MLYYTSEKTKSFIREVKSMDSLIFIVIWILFGIASGIIAKKKNRDQTLWFVFGVLGGLITVIIISFLPPV